MILQFLLSIFYWIPRSLPATFVCFSPVEAATGRVHVVKMAPFFSVKCETIGGWMGVCHSSETGGGLFGSSADQCYCPDDFMWYYVLSESELAYCFSQEEPSGWSNTGQYCGSTSLNCVDPNCVTY